MKGFVILVAFLEFVIVTSLTKRKAVSLSLNAPNKIPIRGFLLDDNYDKVSPSKLKSIEKVMKSQQYQLNKMIAVSKDNSNSVSAIKSDLTDLSKAVTGLQKALRKQANPANGGYIGCYKDDGVRHLKHKVSSLGSSITLAKCREHCKGYKYTGLQYSTYCLCGNVLENKKYPKVADSECNMACAGEKTRKCGGGWRNSIYLVKP
ncbi:uncharacterized protein LOC127715185 [Mytilus californianus]|uniref:uncharacterized protein LOC127715185 n=1 Tax=Mytilus californianus TaxID=6549 RepID=UPI002246257A|nr:uncharacterized protein LOC127715185 [Mytilus californianus]